MLLKTQGGQFNWEQNGYLKYLHTKYAFESNYQTLIADEGVPYDSSRPSIYKRCLLGNGSDTIDLSDGIVGTLTLKGWVKVSSWSYGDITTGLSGTTLTLQSSTYYKSIERYDDGVLVDTFMLEEGAGDRVYSPQGNRGTITSSDLTALRTTQDDAPILETSGDIQGFSEYLYFDGVNDGWTLQNSIDAWGTNGDYVEFAIWDKEDDGTTSQDIGRWLNNTSGGIIFYLRSANVDFRFYDTTGDRWQSDLGGGYSIASLEEQQNIEYFRITRASNTDMTITAKLVSRNDSGTWITNGSEIDVVGTPVFDDVAQVGNIMGNATSGRYKGVMRYIDFSGTVYDKNNIPALSSGSNQLICIPAQAADPTKDLAGGNTEFQGRKNFPVSPQAVNGSMLALDPTLDTYVTLNSPITHAGDTTLTLEFLVTRFNTTGTNCTILGSTDDATSEIGISYVSGSTYQLYYTWDGSSSTSNRVISNLPSDFIFKITIEKNSALGTADTIDNLRINITDLQGNSVIDSGQWTTYIGAEWTDKLDLFYRNSGGTKEFDGGVVVVRAYNDSTLVHEWQHYGNGESIYWDRGNNHGIITSANLATSTIQQSIYDNRVLYGYSKEGWTSNLFSNDYSGWGEQPEWNRTDIPNGMRVTGVSGTYRNDRNTQAISDLGLNLGITTGQLYTKYKAFVTIKKTGTKDCYIMLDCNDNTLKPLSSYADDGLTFLNLGGGEADFLIDDYFLTEKTIELYSNRNYNGINAHFMDIALRAVSGDDLTNVEFEVTNLVVQQYIGDIDENGNASLRFDVPASISTPTEDAFGNTLSNPSIIGVYDGTQLTTPDFCSTDTFLYNNQHLTRDNGTYKDRFLMPIPYGDIDQNLPAWTNRSDSTNTVGDYFKLDSEINLSGVAELEVMWLGYTPKGYVQTILGGSNSSDNVYHLAIDSSGLLGGANGWSSTAPSLPSDFIFKYVINYIIIKR